jgi:hypothetical protein
MELDCTAHATKKNRFDQPIFFTQIGLDKLVLGSNLNGGYSPATAWARKWTSTLIH